MACGSVASSHCMCIALKRKVVVCEITKLMARYTRLKVCCALFCLSCIHTYMHVPSCNYICIYLLYVLYVLCVFTLCTVYCMSSILHIILFLLYMNTLYVLYVCVHVQEYEVKFQVQCMSVKNGRLLLGSLSQFYLYNLTTLDQTPTSTYTPQPFSC